MVDYRIRKNLYNNIITKMSFQFEFFFLKQKFTISSCWLYFVSFILVKSLQLFFLPKKNKKKIAYDSALSQALVRQREKKISRKLRANRNKTATNSDATKINLDLQKNIITKICLHYQNSLDFVDIKTVHKKLADFARFSKKRFNVLNTYQKHPTDFFKNFVKQFHLKLFFPILNLCI